MWVSEKKHRLVELFTYSWWERSGRQFQLVLSVSSGNCDIHISARWPYLCHRMSWATCDYFLMVEYGKWQHTRYPVENYLYVNVTSVDDMTIQAFRPFTRIKSMNGRGLRVGGSSKSWGRLVGYREVYHSPRDKDDHHH